MYEKGTTITHWSDDEDDADTHEFYTTLTQAIDECKSRRQIIHGNGWVI